MPLLGGSQREARETAQRLSRPVAHRESGFPVPGLSGLHPRQFTGVAPLSIRAHGSSLSLVLIEPPAHVRGGVPPLSIRGDCTPGNSRRVAARDKSRLWQLAIARAHRTANARARPSAWAVNSRPGTAAERRVCTSHQRACAAGAVCRAPAAPGAWAERGAEKEAGETAATGQDFPAGSRIPGSGPDAALFSKILQKALYF